MSHFSAFVPSLPAMHYLMTEVMAATQTRHRLERAQGAEWVDYLNHDSMGTDQLSWHLDPMLKNDQNHYSIEQIADIERGKRELLLHLHSPAQRSAAIGSGISAPMPHWGPVLTSAQFGQLLDKLAAIGVDETILAPQLHHANLPAEHATLFLMLGNLALEIKGYANTQGITVSLKE